MKKSRVFAALALACSMSAFALEPQMNESHESVNVVTQDNDETEVTGNLIGTEAIEAKQLIGTWTFDEFAAAYNNVENLKKGGEKATTDLLAKALGRLGGAYINKSTKLSFYEDGMCEWEAANDQYGESEYSVSEATLKLRVVGYDVQLNAKIENNTLQLLVPFEIIPLPYEMQDAMHQFMPNLQTNGLYLGIKMKR